MNNFIKKLVSTIGLISVFSKGISSNSFAVTGSIPQPIIGAANGFYAGKEYSVNYDVGNAETIEKAS